MPNDSSGLVKILLSILFFPVFFQHQMLALAWGVGDPTALRWVKWLFLLLPVAMFLLACWVTIACAVSVVIRPRRGEFVTAILVTWWDLGRSVFIFWGGGFRFLFVLGAAVFAALKVAIAGLWALVKDFILFPFRAVRDLGENVIKAGVPWIAVLLTLIWTVLEAAIFTYVTTPIVIDTFSNMTGNALSETTIRIPLFVFMLFIVLGSYAVLSSFADSWRTKNIGAILKIGVVELVVMFVEVIFLYREFVDSLIPWFAQHAQNFEPGIFFIIAIASMAWLGVRGISWFLFASAGTPTLLAVLRGTGVRVPTHESPKREADPGTYTESLWKQLREDVNFIEKKGEEVLAAFLIPPLQLVAAGVNFVSLLFTAEHLFKLPFRSMEEIMDSKVVLHSVGKLKFGASKE